MKKSLFLVLSLLLLAITSCRKKTATCSHNIYYFPFGFVFEGFAIEEIDTFYLKQYEIGSNFSNLFRVDTFTITNYDTTGGIISRHSNDTSMISNSVTGFAALGMGVDYILELPQLQTLTKIFDIKDGPKSDTFEVEGHCSPGAGQARFRSFTAKFESEYAIALKYGKTGSPRDNIAWIRK